MKGVGRIYQQTFIDTYSKVVFAKLYDRKTPITAADLLNDRVVGNAVCGRLNAVREGSRSDILMRRGFFLVLKQTFHHFLTGANSAQKRVQHRAFAGGRRGRQGSEIIAPRAFPGRVLHVESDKRAAINGRELCELVPGRKVFSGFEFFELVDS